MQSQRGSGIHADYSSFGVIEQVGSGIVGKPSCAKVKGDGEDFPQENVEVFLRQPVFKPFFNLEMVAVVGVLQEMLPADVYLAGVHDVIELMLDVIRLPQRPEVQVVGLAELFLLFYLHPLRIYVQESLVIPSRG